MVVSSRDSRFAELVGLRGTDPARLIAMYRQVAGLGVDNQLPHGVSFMRMIEAILNNELLQRAAIPAASPAENS